MNADIEQIRQLYNETIDDEVKFSILLALEINDSLNLKKLSELLGRPETTVIRYTKKLLEEKLIVIDIERTATDWGKFYRLSDEVLEIINERKKRERKRANLLRDEFKRLKDKDPKEQDDFMKMVLFSKDDIEFTTKSAKRYFAIAVNIQKMILNKFVMAIEDFMKLYNEKGKEYIEDNLHISPCDIEMWETTIKIGSTQQLFELVEFSINKHNELVKMKERFEKEMKESNISEDDQNEIYLYSFLGSMDFEYWLDEKD